MIRGKMPVETPRIVKPPLTFIASSLLFLTLLAALSLTLLLPPEALPAGGTFYVAPGGSDAGPGTQQSPFGTIQHAVDTAGPGDSVVVRGGTYAEAVAINNSGAQDQPLIIAAYPGEHPVLDGNGGSLWAAFQFAQGTAWIDLGGFTVTGYRTAIDVMGTNSHIDVTGLDVSGSEVGMRMTWGYSAQDPMYGPVDHITIADSSFHDNHFSGIDCTPGRCDDISLSGVDVIDNGVGAQSFGADGLAVERGARITVTDTRLINNGGDGLDLNSRDGGPVEGINVSRSVAASNHRNGMKLWAGGLIENCLVYGTGFNPLSLAAFSNVSVELVNNTFAMNMWDPSFAVRDYGMTVGYPEGEIPQSGIDLTMVNNIFAFNTGPDVGSPTGIYLGPGVTLVAENHNIFYSREDAEITAGFTPQPYYSRADIASGVWAADTGMGEGDITLDPMFADGAAADFHPLGGSPVIDAGSAAGAPAVDIEGRQRPRGAGIDIGAYEGPSTNTPQPTLTWSFSGAFWASYGDFLARDLDVRYRLANAGPGGALAVQVVSAESTSGASVLTPLPISLGDLPAASSLPVILRYHVPNGVPLFRTITQVTGTDADGVQFSYPDI